MPLKSVGAYRTLRPRLTLETLTNTLNTGATASQPSAYPHYNTALVLFLNWASDTLRVRKARDALLSHMSNERGFVTDEFEVPVTDGAEALEEKLRSVQNQWGTLEECLVVVVVHGYMAVNPKLGRMMWTPFINGFSNRQLDSTSIDWHFAKAYFESKVRGTVAYLYDVNFVGPYVGPPQGKDEDIKNAAVFPHTLIDLVNVGGKYNGRAEILASNCWGLNKNGQRVGYMSLLLLEALKERRGAPVTIAQLYSAIYQKSIDLEYEVLPLHIAPDGLSSITISCPGTVVLAKSPEPFSFHRDPATPMQLAATPGPVTFSPASDKNSETEMIEEIVPEEVENMDTGENDAPAATPPSYHGSPPAGSEESSDDESEASVEFVLESPAAERGRSDSAAGDKGKEKVVSRAFSAEVATDAQSSTTTILLTACVRPPTSVATVQRDFETMFARWAAAWKLSGPAKVEYVRVETGRFGGVFVVVAVPVEVWTMVGLWNGWQFLEVVVEGGDEGVVGKVDDSVPMEISDSD